jgi:hypothetical protein
LGTCNAGIHEEGIFHIEEIFRALILDTQLFASRLAAEDNIGLIEELKKLQMGTQCAQLNNGRNDLQFTLRTLLMLAVDSCTDER